MRVTVDDGFNQARATSTPFVAVGTPPIPRIVLPADGTTIQAGRQLLLGSATDDRGRRLTGRSLTWFAGTHRLGSGEHLTATLAAGHIALRLRARDARGATAVVTRTLTFTPVPLRIRSLTAPDRVRAGATHITVNLATSIAATIRVGGQTYRLGSTARPVPVPLPNHPKTGVAKVHLTLTGPDGQTAHAIVAFLRS